MAEEGMTFLRAWLNKPRAIVRIDATAPLATWLRSLRRPFRGKQVVGRARIEVLDRLSLGGKKSLLLISIEGRRLLIGIGDDASPSISTFDAVPSIAGSRQLFRNRRTSRRGKMVR
jgi:flagellar biogenesis protein FliO